ncbi:MAG: leucine-rich repeat domain-containing protein [Promethearchaeota archaeon]
MIGKKTFIYINDKQFIQCKRLVLTIPVDDATDETLVDSIDTATEMYGSIYDGRIYEVPAEEIKILPEEEFWGHCSNIQAWYENGYDTRLIHSNLAFPLLKALMDAGDDAARNALNAELYPRLKNGYFPAFVAVVESDLILYLSREELDVVMGEVRISRSHLAEAVSFLNYLKNNINGEMRNIFRIILQKYAHILERMDLEDLEYYEFDQDLLLENCSEDDWRKIFNGLGTFEQRLDFLRKILYDMHPGENEGTKLLVKTFANEYHQSIKKVVKENDPTLLKKISNLELLCWMDVRFIQDILSLRENLSDTFKFIEELHPYRATRGGQFVDFPPTLVLGAILSHVEEFKELFSQHDNSFIMQLNKKGYFDLDTFTGEYTCQLIEQFDISRIEKETLLELAREYECIIDFDVKGGHVIFIGLRGIFGETNLSFQITKRLSHLPRVLAKLEYLEGIDISDNELTALPEFFLKFKNLTYLNLCGNKISVFPEIILKLKPLRHLDLSFTDLKGIPREIQLLKNLEYLECSYCNLTSIPDSLVKLKGMKVLRLDENDITEFPLVLCKMVNLEELRIHLRGLKDIPECIVSLVNIKKLFFSKEVKLSQKQLSWIENNDIEINLVYG